MNMKFLSTVCLGILFFGSLASAEESTDKPQDRQEIVRAKIGVVLSSDRMERQAKTLDRVKNGDHLRIYICSEFDPAYVYVIYNNQEQIQQLVEEPRQKIVGNFALLLPSENDFYEIDGQNSLEQLTIISSPKPLSDIQSFFQSQNRSPEKWQELEQKLMKESKVDLSDTVSRPWSIAGGVRGSERVVNQFRMSSGKTFVVKKYAFRVEN